jgi:hypothetical protein
MCEPNHSIVQWDDNSPDDDESGGSGTPQSVPFSDADKESRVKAVFGGVAKWLKKLGGFLNLSKFGAGHSSTTGRVTSVFGRDIKQVGRPILYETQWWSLAPPKLDGSFTVPGVSGYYFNHYSGRVIAVSDKGYWTETIAPPEIVALGEQYFADALASAAKYDVLRCTQNMSVFRRFLEESLHSTEHPGGYVYNFLHGVCTADARDAWFRKVRKIASQRFIATLSSGHEDHAVTQYWTTTMEREFAAVKKQIIAATIGLTRNRSFLKSHFATCDRLWT